MSNSSLKLPPPLGYRKDIPLYYPKTEAEIKADNYEIYNPNVLRSCRNFYEGNYGKVLLEEVSKYLPTGNDQNIVELGCGSGYLLGNIARNNPDFRCFGFDYSYQMLKMAAQVFRNKKLGNSAIQALQNGMADMEIPNQNLSNIEFALSDACMTPLPDQSVDFCFSCFLWDRVADPNKLLEEKLRVLKPQGRIMIISPFNYLGSEGWKTWYPIDKIISKIEDRGLKIIHRRNFNIEEMLDLRRNRVVWEVESLVFEKY
ncbi:class I SAM-dependent methyltransferase [Portibacter lacus]|uniref:Methyltransferase type 11 domain-containing protein n=1 Tax=Portibacter lacus TaxID=1099794 RepID=A0AA37SU06_9BACT|nr:class I SAM-dependent methyltransferase [Portibacter lacus]GLR18005.1 hypothetical protein GCM10007940_26200 [Portibacter lacus]